MRLAIVNGTTQLYAFRKGTKEVAWPMALGDLGVKVEGGAVYPPYQSVYSWMKFRGGYRRGANADDFSIPNIEELVLEAERLSEPVDIATGQAVAVGQGRPP